MSTVRLLLVCALLLPVLAGCNSKRTVDPTAEAEVIRRLSAEWSAAFEAKDLDAIMTYYAPDAVQMPANRPSLEGREDIRAWYELWLPNPAVVSTFTPEVIEVAASGDLAYDRGVYHFRMDTPDGTFEDHGKYLIIWKKIDGEWKTLLDISNSDRIPTAD